MYKIKKTGGTDEFSVKAIENSDKYWFEKSPLYNDDGTQTEQSVRYDWEIGDKY